MKSSATHFLYFGFFVDSIILFLCGILSVF